MKHKTQLLSKLATIMITLVFIFGCGGSGSGGTTPANSDGNDDAIASTISGTAAAGSPIIGFVNVKDAAGRTASSSIDIDGSYSIRVPGGLTLPIILYAEGSVNGKSIKIYSAGLNTGIINITPITDFILRNAMGEHPDTIYNSWESTPVEEGNLTSAETDAQTQLAPLLSAVGVPSSVDLLSTPFTANQTGLDFVLDSISISYSGDISTVENNLTGSSYTDDITISGDGAGLPPSDETDTQVILDDLENITAVWKSLEDLYFSTPSNSEVINWITNNVADDYVSEGESKIDMQDEWINGEGPPVGLTISAVIIEPFDIADTIYTKGYWIRVFVSNVPDPGNFIDCWVFDGTNWLWFGDRKWVGKEADAHAFMYVNSSNQRYMQTGMILSLEDDTNYAYDQGVRSAIIKGPGLPTNGVIYEHKFPEPEFGEYTLSGDDGSFYVIDNDATIAAIPINAEYNFSLCSELAEDLFNNVATCTELKTGTITMAYPPVLNAELTTSMFANLTNPSTHDVSALNFGGDIIVNWTIPAGSESIWGHLSWSNSSIDYVVEMGFEDNDNSATFDTSGLPDPDSWAGIFIKVEDSYGRDFNMGWELY